MLEGEIDAPLLGLHPDDLELDFLALLDEVLGSRNVAPAHVVDVKEAVEAAEVDEGAEGGEALDFALDGIADLGLLEEILAALLDVLFHPFSAVEDDVDFLLGIEALEVELRLEPDELVALLDALDVGLRGRKEAAEAVAEVDLEAALDLLVDDAVDRQVILERVGDRSPIYLLVGPLLGYDDLAGVRLFLDEYDADHFADLGGIVPELDDRNLAF